MKWTYKCSEDQVQEYGLNSLEVGSPALVISLYNVETGKENYYLRFDSRAVNEGYPGNVNPAIRRFHGWRGTTDNIAVYAHGVYIIRWIQKLPDGGLKIKLGKTDIKKNEE